MGQAWIRANTNANAATTTNATVTANTNVSTADSDNNNAKSSHIEPSSQHDLDRNPDIWILSSIGNTSRVMEQY